MESNKTKFEIGDRVTSTEVTKNDFGGVYQDKHLEIHKILEDGKVECIYFSEAKVNQSKERIIVSYDSLRFINKETLKEKPFTKDDFFERNRPKK